MVTFWQTLNGVSIDWLITYDDPISRDSMYGKDRNSHDKCTRHACYHRPGNDSVSFHRVYSSMCLSLGIKHITRAPRPL